MYHLTKKRLLLDLYKAFYDAKKHKSNKSYVLKFEKDLHNNLTKLRDQLWEQTYEPKPSTCFIIDYPKKREIFAAEFVDRIVHHLYFNYTQELYERTFIYDSYSCIKNKGTHFGIDRLKHHIRSESLNYTRTCYVLKLDIRGYFININREKLYNIVINQLNKMKTREYNNNTKKTWADIIDFDFIEYLSKKILLLDPTKKAIIIGKKEDWDGLDFYKSLFNTNSLCGLPIGNLTSQLSSNIYLNLLDQFIKRILKCKHYGRYVDDFYIVSHNKEFLLSIIELINDYLKTELELDINLGKTKIINIKNGVEFLGSYIKPYRTYISNTSFKRIQDRLWKFRNYKNLEENYIYSSVNSLLGVLQHYNSYNIKKELFNKQHNIKHIGLYEKYYQKLLKYTG